VRSGDADAVRVAADELAGAATGVRRLWNQRKGGTAPRPSAAPGEGEWVVVVDGLGIVRDAGFKPSLQRDIALARKRVAAGAGRPDRGVNRPSDEVLAQGKVLRRSEVEAAAPARRTRRTKAAS
jgi:hypothetical protein